MGLIKMIGVPELTYRTVGTDYFIKFLAIGYI